MELQITLVPMPFPVNLIVTFIQKLCMYGICNLYNIHNDYFVNEIKFR